MSDKKTVLYDIHEELNAKIAPFGGYLMPIQYEGILKEHEACREGAAIFDTCHMGEFFFSGESAVTDLEKLVSCPVASIETGQCRYGFLCNEEGGVIDDMILYRLDDDYWMMVVNSATQDGDFTWITSHLSEDTTVENRSDETAKIDIQGPASAKIVAQLVKESIADLKYFRFNENEFEGSKCIVSRTGYTGEIGFEIYIPSEDAELLWNKATELGAVPAGLGARDTLRLEMGMPLYGHELDTKRNPRETGYDRSIKEDTPFIGSEALFANDTKIILTGLLFESRQKPKDGDRVLDSDGNEIGYITSAGFSPTLNCAAALAYIHKEIAEAGTEVETPGRRKNLKAKLTSLPLYKEATGRKKLEGFL